MQIKFVNEGRRAKAIHSFNGENPYIKTFCIITPDNPMSDPQATAERNKMYQKDFRDDLNCLAKLYYTGDKGSLSYFKANGKYDRLEHSYVIYNIALADAEYLAKRYDQESFIFANVNHGKVEFEYWEIDRETGRYDLKDTETEVATHITGEDMFTSLGRNFKFNIPFKCFEEAMEIIASIVDDRMKNVKGYSEIYESYLESVVSNKGTLEARAKRSKILWG